MRLSLETLSQIVDTLRSSSLPRCAPYERPAAHSSNGGTHRRAKSSVVGELESLKTMLNALAAQLTRDMGGLQFPKSRAACSSKKANSETYSIKRK